MPTILKNSKGEFFSAECAETRKPILVLASDDSHGHRNDAGIFYACNGKITRGPACGAKGCLNPGTIPLNDSKEMRCHEHHSEAYAHNQRSR